MHIYFHIYTYMQITVYIQIYAKRSKEGLTEHFILSQNFKDHSRALFLLKKCGERIQNSLFEEILKRLQSYLVSY